MNDLCDDASQEEERERTAALAVRKPAGPPPCSACYWCGESLKGDRRFCDKFCADSWQYAEDRK